MAHHEFGPQVVLDDQGAEDRLADHAERQQRPEHGQVPAVGTPEEGEDGGGDHDDADEAGDQPVAELDHRVRFQRRRGAAVAFGPVRAAEAGAGEPHAGAGEDDQREGAEGDGGELRVALGGDLEAVSEALPHRQRIMAAAGWPPVQLPGPPTSCSSPPGPSLGFAAPFLPSPAGEFS